MNSQLMQIIIPAVVGLATAIVTYLVARNNSNKELTINDRQQLSEDEKQFRLELKDTINSYKADLEASRTEIKLLREEVASLHKINLELTLENKQLQLKVDGLSNEVKSFKVRGE